MKLEEIQNYCKGKRIIVIGNSSSIFGSKKGKFIDSHDIIVRMNYALPIKEKWTSDIGSRTDIYSVGISSSKIVKNILTCTNNLKTVLRLTPYSDKINSPITYHYSKSEYTKIKERFGKFKPSTGCTTISFFKDHIDYKLLNILGFDFFQTSHSSKKNEFKSFQYRDHNGFYEREFILSCLNDKTRYLKL
jgi:hypothetical protein